MAWPQFHRDGCELCLNSNPPGGFIDKRLELGAVTIKNKMLLKVTLVLALGSLGVLLLHRLRESEDEVSLERKVEAQLQALREHLFQR